MIIVDNDNFENEVINSEIPVLVDFWAEWCGPCRMLFPLIEEIAKQNEGKLKVCKIDSEQCSELAVKYGIKAIPTLKIFVKGENQATQIGALNRNQLIDFVKPFIL